MRNEREAKEDLKVANEIMAKRLGDGEYKNRSEKHMEETMSTRLKLAQRDMIEYHMGTGRMTKEELERAKKSLRTVLR